MIAPAIVSISRLVLKCVLSTEKPGLLLYEGRSGLLEQLQLACYN